MGMRLIDGSWMKMIGARPALLVVDVVRAYVEPSRPLYAQGVVDALEPNRRLVAAARGAGVTMIFTGVRYDAEGRDGGQFFRMVPALKGFVAGSPLGAFQAVSNRRRARRWSSSNARNTPRSSTSIERWPRSRASAHVHQDRFRGCAVTRKLQS